MQVDHYDLGLLAVSFSEELSRDTSLFSNLFDETVDQKSIKSLFVLTLLDESHRQNAMQKLQEKDSHYWTKGHLNVNLNTRQGRADISKAVATNRR